MAKYQHASGAIVDAVQFEPGLPQEAWPKGVTWWDGYSGPQPIDMSWGFLDTPAGRHYVMAGDWILTDAAGGQRVCGPSVFEAEYKPVSPTASGDKAVAQAHAASLSGPKPGEVYRHYKGGIYSITATAVREDTLVPIVVYHSNLHNVNRERTLANFCEVIEVDGKPTPRFSRVAS